VSLRVVTHEPARYMIFSTRPASDVVEHRDSQKVGFGSRGRSWRMVRDDAPLGYRDGE
jgi:hypothetical protein